MKLKFKLLGLFSILGLSFLSFSNSGYVREVGIFGYSPYDNSMALAVNVKGQLLSDKGQIMRDMLFIDDTDDRDSSRAFFFWTNTGYPYMYKKISSTPYEGVPNAYKLCDELLENDTDGPNNCGDWILFNDETKESMNSFLSTIQNGDLYFYETSYRNIKVAFSSSTLSKSLYFGYTTSSDTSVSTLGRDSIITGSSLGFGSAIDYASFNDSYLGQSPGVSSVFVSSGDSSSTSPLYTIDTVYNCYAENGFVTSLCYSDYPLSDVINSNTTISELYEPYLNDSTYFTGATIFDLYNAYGGSVPFSSFMGTYQAGYKIITLRNDIPNFYQGKSKGLFYIFYKINLNHDNISEVSSDLYNYCTFALQKDSLTGTNSFNNSYINSGSLPNSVSKCLLEGKENVTRIPICTPGSALCDSMSGSGSGSGSGSSGTVIKSSDDGVLSFLENFKSLFGIVDSQEDLNSEGDGILPYYIGLGFIAFLLLYLLKR